jgi:hypothetical protein
VLPDQKIKMLRGIRAGIEFSGLDKAAIKVEKFGGLSIHYTWIKSISPYNS